MVYTEKQRRAAARMIDERAERGRKIIAHYYAMRGSDPRGVQAALSLIGDVLHAVHSGGFKHSIMAAAALGEVSNEIHKAE